MGLAKLGPFEIIYGGDPASGILCVMPVPKNLLALTKLIAR